MKLLFAMTYYRPYISGVTVYNQRMAEGLARRGHHVTVLTSRYDAALPEQAVEGGINVVRLPVALRVSKGALMRGYGARAAELAAAHDAIVMSLPNTPLEIFWLTRLARRLGRPLIGAYHCDITLPPGLFNALVTRGVACCNLLAAARADALLSYSVDYSLHSRLLRGLGHKLVCIVPPIAVATPDPVAVAELRRRHADGGRRLIGVAARLAPEKGIEYLPEGLGRIERAAGAPVRLLMVGDTEHVIGEEPYRTLIGPLLAALGDRVALLGQLSDVDLSAFYAACDVLALPSVNPTESFGMVQVEAMLCGTPVVASDLPGVRAPVQMTGMGRLAPPRDAEALADAIAAVLAEPERYRRGRRHVEAIFSLERALDRFEEMLEVLRPGANGRSAPIQPPLLEGPLLHASRRDYLADHLRELPAFRALVRAVECRLLEQAAPFEQPVLDLGCGDGHFASLAFSGAVFAGVDPEAGALREAHRWGVYRHLTQADATALPWPDGSMRTVIANSVLEHIEHLEPAVAEIARVLAPGGRLLLTVPSDHFAGMLLGAALARALGLPRAAAAYGRWFNRHSRHYHCDSVQTWRRRLERHGLEITRRQHYLTPAAHRAFDLAHWLSLPRLVSRRLTGRWVPVPTPANPLLERWLRPHCLAEPREVGPYLFIEARRAAP